MAKRILIVDDVNAEQDALRRMLSTLDVEINHACNGQEAINQINRLAPDLILMDIIMPVMDGFSATRKIKSNQQTRNIPIILVSSKNEQADHVWAQLQGAERLIAKPLQSQSLMQEVQKWI